ncbi:unnamed protein product, partial [Prunus brigantina]
GGELSNTSLELISLLPSHSLPSPPLPSLLLPSFSQTLSPPSLLLNSSNTSLSFKNSLCSQTPFPSLLKFSKFSNTFPFSLKFSKFFFNVLNCCRKPFSFLVVIYFSLEIELDHSITNPCGIDIALTYAKLPTARALASITS